MNKPSIEIGADAEQLAVKARDLVAQLVHEAVRVRGRFTIALSGGSTPKRFHTLLAETEGLPWAQMHFFWGDDRHVPPDHADSNYRMARETLFDHVPQIPKENIHRIHTEEREAATAAELYETELKTFFGKDAWPRFDVMFLGLGPDGHTASLFPGTRGIAEKQRWVMAQWVEKLKTDRITLTPPVLNASRAVLFLVQGEDKASAVHEVLEGSQPVEEIPARIVRPDPGGLWWLLDAPAASKLSDATLGRKKVR